MVWAGVGVTMRLRLWSGSNRKARMEKYARQKSERRLLLKRKEEKT